MNSQVSKKITCGRKKSSCIVSDGLVPYLMAKVKVELCQPGVYFAIEIDEIPKLEQRVQQLDMLVH